MAQTAADAQLPSPVELNRGTSGKMVALARSATAQGRAQLERSVSDKAKVEDEQPKLVRGLSSVSPSDKPALAALVVKALSADPGWGAISDFSAVQIKDVSGMGGSKTFKVVPPEGADPKPNPPVVALHSRTGGDDLSGGTAHGEYFMLRMRNACLAMSKLGLAPSRLAEGGDWFIETWDADGEKVPHETPEHWMKIGKLLANVHQTPIDWFEKFREEMLSRVTQASETPKGSHAWLFLSRYTPAQFTGCLCDADVYKAFADMGAAGPAHPAAARVVTCHGDFHPGNLVHASDDRLKVIDFEFSCVTSAVFDLAFGLFCAGSVEKKDAFLTGYLEGSGMPATDLDKDKIKLDAACARLYYWLPNGMLPAWDIDGKPKEEALELINEVKEFATWIRESEERQQILFQGGLTAIKKKFPPWQLDKKMRKGNWYPLMESKLAAAAAEADPSAAITTTVDVAAAVASGAKLVVIKVKADQQKALQVRPGTSRLELGNLESECRNQQWLLSGGTLQHVGTGLFLDTEVKYAFHKLGACWETCGTELFVKARDEGSPNQQWDVEPSIIGGHLIRHLIDGRGVDVNCWDLQAGQGVNVNLFHSDLKGCLWMVDGIGEEERPAGTWAEYSNIDMYDQGDMHEIENWSRFTTLDQLKRTVERRGYSAITVVQNEDSDGAAVKAFDFQLTPEHCKPTTDYKCVIHIWTPAPADAAVAPSRSPVPPIAPIAEGECFYIKVACARDFCLSHRADGYTKDPYEIYLAAFDGSEKQQWRLVGGDQIQNVETGRFLHTFTKYPYVKNLAEPWDDNHTDLVLRPQDFSDKQRWVWGPEEFNGGKVLRHYKDGRGVDVHGWQMKDGQNMGCENAVHSDCRGNCYVFEVVSS